MNATEAISKIANLLGMKFNKENFYTTILIDGETEVTNNSDKEYFDIGDTIYVVGESTLTPAPAGEHTTREGITIVLNEESVVTEVKEASEEEVVEEAVQEVVEAKSETEEEMSEEIDFAQEISQIKEGLSQILEVMTSLNGKFSSEINTIKNDFEKFKKLPNNKPVEKKVDRKKDFLDFKVDFFKEINN